MGHHNIAIRKGPEIEGVGVPALSSLSVKCPHCYKKHYLAMDELDPFLKQKRTCECGKEYQIPARAMVKTGGEKTEGTK